MWEDSKNARPWPEETVIDPQETVCKWVLRMIFYFTMDDRNVRILSIFTSAMCSSKISANTQCDTLLNIYMFQKAREVLSPALPCSPSGPPLQG